MYSYTAKQPDQPNSVNKKKKQKTRLKSSKIKCPRPEGPREQTTLHKNSESNIVKQKGTVLKLEIVTYARPQFQN